ncbi:MAG: hypothetical protein RI988_2801 [Pseudomonadota bacterium]|jgi:hypothetical protein
MKRNPDGYQRELVNRLHEPYCERLEIGPDVGITELVRALAAGGLTLTNVAGRGLRIVRAPTPAKED